MKFSSDSLAFRPQGSPGRRTLEADGGPCALEPGRLPDALRAALRRSHLLLGLALVAGAARAAPEPVRLLTVKPASVHPGDVVLVAVAVLEEPKGTLGGRPLAFYRQRDHFEALVAVPLETAAGAVPVSVELLGKPPIHLSEHVQVLASRFESKSLTVETKYAEPAQEQNVRIHEDQAAVHASYGLPLSPRLFREAFLWPRPPRFSAHFGDRRVYNGKLTNQHYAADLLGRTGDPVVATNDGRVVLVRDCYLTGNTVVIFHGGGVFSTYAHLSEVAVKQGQDLHRGDLLGRVGRTGRATGPHLHFAVRADGLYVNPESLMALSFP